MRLQYTLQLTILDAAVTPGHAIFDTNGGSAATLTETRQVGLLLACLNSNGDSPMWVLYIWSRACRRLGKKVYTL